MNVYNVLHTAKVWQMFNGDLTVVVAAKSIVEAVAIVEHHIKVKFSEAREVKSVSCVYQDVLV